MKAIFIILICLLQTAFLFGQTVTGIIVDQFGRGLPGLQVKLYAKSKNFTTTTSTDGSFKFTNVTSIDRQSLPPGYSISNNYPNPFNPKTRLAISLPSAARVKIDVYNTLGQRVMKEMETQLNAGDNSVDLDLNGLPNGSYFARIAFDEKHSVVRKIMLIYGSQHLTSVPDAQTYPTGETALGVQSDLLMTFDSLVATGSSIARTVFKSLPNLTGSSLDLGNLIVTLPLASLTGHVFYSGTTIPISGVTVAIDDQLYTTASDGKYQLSNLTAGSKTLLATKTGYDSFSNSISLAKGADTLNIEMTSALYTHNLSGTVSSSITLQPVPQVSVTVLNDDGTPSQLMSSSDFSGYYQVPTVPQGQRKVTFSRQSYHGYTAQLFMSNSDYKYDVQLSPICPSTTVVYAGKTYSTVPIGSQCWLTENLDVGTMINGSLSQANDGKIEKWCYNNDSINCAIYGGLYQWNEAMQYSTTAGAQGICPSGWHMPTYAEIDTLIAFVGGDGNALKAIGQGTGTAAGTNTSGFSALLGGFSWFPTFAELHTSEWFWSSTPPDPTWIYILTVSNYGNLISDRGMGYSVTMGLSIRCIAN